MINPNEINIRASAMSLVMTNARSGGGMGDTAKSYLKKLVRELKYDRYQEIETKAMRRGVEHEEEGISLYSLHAKKMFRKNEKNWRNSFFTGTPDIFTMNKEVIVRGFDIKCPLSIFTMPFKDEKLDSAYFYQNMTYCDLTGAESFTTVYTLLNWSADMIDAEKRKMSYGINSLDPTTTDEYKQKSLLIEKNFIVNMAEFQRDYPYYDLETDLSKWEYDIPMSDRIIEFEVKRDEAVLKSMRDRVIECREYIKTII